MYKINDVLNSLGIVLLGIVLFGGGFYFGGKTTAATMTKELQTNQDISSFAQNVTAEPVVEATSKGLEVSGVSWIRVGQAPVCPETHPIKGKFDTNVNVYYLQDHKSYEKVKAEICFSDEAFASQSAGFIRKY
jgi:hypothetical protein